MKLTRSLFCLSVLAALSCSSCTTQPPISDASGTTNVLAIGNSPIRAHRMGFVNPNASDSFGGYGGGYNAGYAFYPMPTENFGDYFNPDNDPNIVGNGWDRYNTEWKNYYQVYNGESMEPAPWDHKRPYTNLREAKSPTQQYTRYK